MTHPNEHILLRMMPALLIAGSSFLLSGGTAAHAQDSVEHGHPTFPHEHASSTPVQSASSSQPVQPEQPTHPSYLFTPYPFYPVARTTPPAPTSTVASTSVSSTTATAPATSTAPTAAQAKPPAPDPSPSLPAAVSRIKEALFPGSAYPADHLSPATTRRFMLLAGILAASGVTFLLYGTAASAFSRRAARRQFRRIPVAAR